MAMMLNAVFLKKLEAVTKLSLFGERGGSPARNAAPQAASNGGSARVRMLYGGQ